MSVFLRLTLVLLAIDKALGYEDPNEASYGGCVQPRGEQSLKSENGFVPGLYITTSNLPGATWNKDGSVVSRNVVCAHQDRRTAGGSVVIPWAQFDKRDSRGRGYYNWTFVDDQMKPWVDRGQMVNLLVWPAAQKKNQLFPNGASATPAYIMDRTDITYQCPSGAAQGDPVESIPLPMFWKEEIYRKYFQALEEFVKHYQDHPNVNYFRFGIGVGAETYPCNGGTTPTNYCMDTFIDLFQGDTKEDRAMKAYETWANYVKNRILALRRFSSKKHIVVTVNSFYTWPTIDKNQFPQMVAHHATKDYSRYGIYYPKLGLGVQGATTASFDGYGNLSDCYADWCNIFNDRKDLGIPLQIQTPLHSGVNGRPGPWQNFRECQINRQNNGRYGCTNTGNLAKLIDYSMSVGATSWELYPYEFLVANDDKWINDPPELNWHEIYGQQYREALDKASNQQLVK